MRRPGPRFPRYSKTGARYVIVDGVAVNLHGHQRFTKDLVDTEALETIQRLLEEEDGGRE